VSDVPETAYDHALKVPVVQRKEYVIRFEQHVDAGTFIHCDVFNWSPEVAKALGQDFTALAHLHGGPIHALHDSRDRKHSKFLRLYGFQKVQDLWDSLELWIWRKHG
jgi:hypothetical protein